jgi:hypothetical protein
LHISNENRKTKEKAKFSIFKSFRINNRVLCAKLQKNNHYATKAKTQVKIHAKVKGMLKVLMKLPMTRRGYRIFILAEASCKLNP